ncbi:MAG: tyrosine-type recombinase/integrase [Archaeoglobaceae archaeon]
MVDERDIHRTKGRLTSTLKHIEDSPEILEENVKTIKGFNDYLRALRSVNIDRRQFYIGRLSILAKWFDKPFMEATRDDILKIQGMIEEGDYTEWTKHDYLLTLKKFFQWLYRDQLSHYHWKSTEYPDVIRDIHVSVGKDANKLPKNLPGKDKVKKMVDNCNNSRNRAIFMTLFDGGFRVGEFLNIKVGDLERKTRGISLIVHGKTGSRHVLMPMAEPYINRWLEDHPNPQNNSYLWVNIGNYNRKKPLEYRALSKILKSARDKAGLSCEINPHAFRKASASFYAQHLNEIQMCDRYGWVYGSDMPRIYIRSSGKETDNAVLRAHGLAEEAETDEGLKPRVCNRCSTANPYDSKWCRNCGMVLDKSQVTEAEDEAESRLMEMIQSNPEKWGSVLLDAMEKSKMRS